MLRVFLHVYGVVKKPLKVTVSLFISELIALKFAKIFQILITYVLKNVR